MRRKLRSILRQMSECANNGDFEASHINADELLVELVESIVDYTGMYESEIREILDQYDTRGDDFMSLKDAIHDAFLSVVKVKPTTEQIVDIASVIPKEILLIGVRWGWSDTVFNDNLFMWMTQGYESGGLQ